MSLANVTEADSSIWARMIYRNRHAPRQRIRITTFEQRQGRVYTRTVDEFGNAEAGDVGASRHFSDFATIRPEDQWKLCPRMSSEWPTNRERPRDA